MRYHVGATLVVALFTPAQNPAPGAALRPGMQLVYGSGAQLQDPWTIDSVATGLALRPGSACAAVHQRRGSAAPANEIRVCLAHDTLYRWRASDNSWGVLRPVGPNMTWLGPRIAGGRVEYQTGALSSDTIGGLVMQVVPTEVVTRDSTGRAIRRLRERYSLGLLTATRGNFEEADASAPGGWRTTQEFSLREIRHAR